MTPVPGGWPSITPTHLWTPHGYALVWVAGSPKPPEPPPKK